MHPASNAAARIEASSNSLAPAGWAAAVLRVFLMKASPSDESFSVRRKILDPLEDSP
jgi:hypothetical protein